MNRLLSSFNLFALRATGIVFSRSLSTRSSAVSAVQTAARYAAAMLCTASMLAFSTPARAQVSPEFRTAPRSLITEKVDRSRMVPVSGAVRAEATSLRDLGEVSPSLLMDHMQLVLQRPVERKAAFDAQTEALHVRGSDSYHKWLTPAVVGSEFGPSSADLTTLTAYLESEGFTVNFVAASGMFIDFTGTAAQVERSFKTSIHSVQYAEGDVRFAAISPASLPEALAPLVFGFLPLSNIPAAHPLLKKRVQSVQEASAYLLPLNTVTANSVYDVGPQDFYTIYNEGPLLAQSINGTGVVVAVIEETDLSTFNDVTTFRKTFNVTPNTPNLTVEHGSGTVTCSDPGVTSTDEEGEAALDAEWASSVAPSANLLYMSCSTTTTAGIFLSAEAIIQNNLADTMSLSYGEYEAGSASEATLSQDLWEQAASQGETVVVSAGDSGSDARDQNASIGTHGINVSGFSSTNWNVSAGGTDFQDGYNYLETKSTTPSAYGYSTYWNATNATGDSSARSYVPEIPWNDTCASSQVSYYFTANSTNPNAGCETSNGQKFLATGGGSGGPSSLAANARASWQNATVFGLPSTSTYPNRLQPDISLFASAGFWGHALNYFQSDVSTTALQAAGGTSFVAPQLAGMFALIVQSTQERQGQPDYVLYDMAAKAYGTTAFSGTACAAGAQTGYDTTDVTAPASTCIFHDIQVGNNSQACSGNTNCFKDSGQTYGIISTSTTTSVPAFNAGSGYDMATGLGSVNIYNLITNWQNTSVGQLFTPVVTLTGATNYTYGAPVASTYTATVSGPGSFPTGSVTFSGATPIGSFGTADALVQSTGCNYKTIGTCTESTTQAYTPSATTVNAGAYTITATYSTTNENYTTGSGTTTLTIAKQTPTLTQAADTYGYGNSTVPVTATLKYTGAGLAPTGGVNFAVNGGASVNGTCTAAGLTLTCTANYPTTGLAAGTAYPVTASYPGDVNYVVVNATNTTLTLTTTAATINFSIASPQHTMVPLTLSTTSNSTGATTYSVVSGPATITSGVATFSAGGTVQIAANQSANASYAATSKTATFTVLAGSIWLGDATNAISTFDLLGNAISSSSGYTGGGVSTVAKPLSEAFDASGNFWVASSAGVSEFNRFATAYSSAPTTTGGISTPKALAIDGQGYIWIANTGGAVSVLNSAGTAISPSTGYTNTGTSTPGGIAVDLSGNVWLTDTSSNTVTEILGVAAPIAPQSTSLANGTTGAKP